MFHNTMALNGGLKDLKGNEIANPYLLVRMIEALDATNRLGSVERYAYGIDVVVLERHIHSLRNQFFSAVMASARMCKQLFVSISDTDLVGNMYCPDQTSIGRHAWAWDIVAAFDIGSVWGNGMGNYTAQYQIVGRKYFNIDQHAGIWDPNTETRIFKTPISLSTDHAFCDELYAAIKCGELKQFTKKWRRRHDSAHAKHDSAKRNG